MNKKKYILFHPGPIHHFFFIPIMLIWNLIKKNEIILILDSSYKDNKYFSKIKSLPKIKDIFFIEEKNSFKNYSSLKKTISKVLMSYEFSEIYTHDPSYVYSYALVLLSKRIQPDAKRTYFQVARDVNSYPKEAEIKINILVQNFKVKFFPEILIRQIMKLKVGLKFLIAFKLLPLLTFGNTFAPWTNPYYPKYSYVNKFIDKGFCLNDQDQIIFFDEKVIDYMNEFFQGLKFNLTKLEFENNLQEIYSYFFDDCVNKSPLISIFPTWGTYKKNLNADWLDIIMELKKNYPDHKIQIKFHPGVKDKFIEDVFIKVSEKVPDIEILSRNTPAFKIISDSSIIIGDTSTVLWFATFFANKIVCSLDLFGFNDGDCLKIYSEKLNYIDDINQLGLLNKR